MPSGDDGISRVRAAQNGFDPSWRATTRVSDESLLQSYRFAMRTVDPLVRRNELRRVNGRGAVRLTGKQVVDDEAAAERTAGIRGEQSG